MNIDQWWPKLEPATREWLMAVANDEEPGPQGISSLT